MHHVTGSQLAFGRRLGLDFAGKSVGEALAMIEDLVERDFLLKEDLGAPTPKQIELAANSKETFPARPVVSAAPLSTT